MEDSSQQVQQITTEDVQELPFCFASDGNLLAVLADSHVELRCLDDDFVVAVAKCAGKLLAGMKING